MSSLASAPGLSSRIQGLAFTRTWARPKVSSRCMRLASTAREQDAGHVVSHNDTLWSTTDIKHKGLRELFERERSARLPEHLVARIRNILGMLEAARSPRDMDVPGFRLHPLKGRRAGQWSVRVSGDWRIVFRFDSGEAVDVDFVDYH